jgi:hypothetical protein
MYAGNIPVGTISAGKNQAPGQSTFYADQQIIAIYAQISATYLPHAKFFRSPAGPGLIRAISPVQGLSLPLTQFKPVSHQFEGGFVSVAMGAQPGQMVNCLVENTYVLFVEKLRITGILAPMSLLMRHC